MLCYICGKPSKSRNFQIDRCRRMSNALPAFEKEYCQCVMEKKLNLKEQFERQSMIVFGIPFKGMPRTTNQ